MELRDCIYTLLIFLGIVALTIVILLSLFQISKLTDNSHCIVKVDGKVYFEGPAYQINCKTQGMATQCSFTTDFFLVKNDFHIISDKITVECK